MLTDPVADMLTSHPQRQQGAHDRTEMPNSKLKVEIARILKRRATSRLHVSDAGAHPTLVVELKYGRGRERVLSGLKRVSKPGRRIYAGKTAAARARGMGIAIMSTSRGVITSALPKRRDRRRSHLLRLVMPFAWRKC